MTSSPITPTPRQDPRATHTGWRSLGRHYLEMVLAMLVGMLVIGTGRDALGLSVPFAEQPGAWYLLMATDMSLAMAAWMR